MNLTRREILEAALIGYRQQVGRISQQIADIEVELRGGNTGLGLMQTVHSVKPKPTARTAKGTGSKAGRHRVSAAGRERIAAAQKARWKKFHAQQKAA